MTTAALDRPTDAQLSFHPNEGKRAEVVRVLHVINGEHYAGAERVQDLLAGGLPEFGFEVGLACLKRNQFPKMRVNRDVPLYEVPMRGRLDLRPISRLVRIVRQGGYDLLHAHTARSVFLAGPVSLITGVPLVYHVHSPAAQETTHRWRNWTGALVERIALLLASAVIAVSHSLGKYAQKRGGAEHKTFVVPNGVPCREPRSIRPPRQRAWTLGTVALFRPRKGVEVLLEALAALRSQGMPVRLRAVGAFETPEYQRRIKRLTAALGLTDAVDWVGFQRDVDTQLARMDLFVLPSLFGEGLPMVILEAMAAGVPVVATRVEGIPEAIREDRDGLIAEPGDPGSLANAIAKVITGDVDWSGLRDRALRRHAETFSDRRMAERVAEVYRHVLGGDRG